MVKHVIQFIGIAFGLAGSFLVYGTINVLCTFSSCTNTVWFLPIFPAFFGGLSGWAIEKLMRK